MPDNDSYLPFRNLLTLREAAEFLGISKVTLRRWTHTGVLTCVRFGNRKDRRFRPDDLEAFIRGNTDEANGVEKLQILAALKAMNGDIRNGQAPGDSVRQKKIG